MCRNPLLADERARKREELLKATEKDLDKIVAATQRTRKPLQGEDVIGLAVGQVIGDHKMKKHFELTITENSIRFESSASEFHQLTESTPLQRRALELLSAHALPEFAFSFQGFISTFH